MWIHINEPDHEGQFALCICSEFYVKRSEEQRSFWGVKVPVESLKKKKNLRISPDNCKFLLNLHNVQS